jgi:hypothetical protein
MVVFVAFLDIGDIVVLLSESELLMGLIKFFLGHFVFLPNCIILWITNVNWMVQPSYLLVNFWGKTIPLIVVIKQGRE